MMVTCDAIIANILADVSFTAELTDHGFSYVGVWHGGSPDRDP